MSIILQVKEKHKGFRLARNKEMTSCYTMLISRADTDRLKYGLKSSDELSDEQMMKVIQAEVKQLKQEYDYSKDSAIAAAIEELNTLLPQELSEEELNFIVARATRAPGVDMGAAMKSAAAVAKERFPNKSVPMKLLSQMIKNQL